MGKFIAYCSCNQAECGGYLCSCLDMVVNPVEQWTNGANWVGDGFINEDDQIVLSDDMVNTGELIPFGNCGQCGQGDIKMIHNKNNVLILCDGPDCCRHWLCSACFDSTNTHNWVVTYHNLGQIEDDFLLYYCPNCAPAIVAEYPTTLFFLPSMVPAFEDILDNFAIATAAAAATPPAPVVLSAGFSDHGGWGGGFGLGAGAGAAAGGVNAAVPTSNNSVDNVSMDNTDD